MIEQTPMDQVFFLAIVVATLKFLRTARKKKLADSLFFHSPPLSLPPGKKLSEKVRPVFVATALEI